jgi:hypothetical protein
MYIQNSPRSMSEASSVAYEQAANTRKAAQLLKRDAPDGRAGTGRLQARPADRDPVRLHKP